jgi:hypothetical protein
LKKSEAQFLLWTAVALISTAATLGYLVLPWIAAKLMHAGY